MFSSEVIRRLWQPETESDRQLIRQELADILESPPFSSSKRYPTLLRYVVEETLLGRADRIKERSLGIEVFHRAPDYDTNNDTVVRYTAGEIRKRLALYYHEGHGRSPVQIVMPIGSYVPEFYRTVETPSAGELESGTTDLPANPDAPLPAPRVTSLAVFGGPSRVHLFSTVALVFAAALVVLVLAVRFNNFDRQTPLDDFWGPVLGDRGSTALISSGGVVFDPNPYTGTATADKNSQYPFVSMQMAAAIARLSGLVERRGHGYEVEPAATATITEMRERPLILVGAYNNPWTLKLVASLPFSFPPEPDEAIVDREHKGVRWVRDRSVAYSNADDYALFGRYRENATDGTVVFVAGLGKNGTEAAAQFITSPRYMRLLEERIGRDLYSKNIEVVLKINVVDGKTGVPSIQAVHVW
jgi:hypothetical protein